MVGLDGLDDGLKVFLTSRHILKQDTFAQVGAIRKHGVDGQGREHPSLDAFVVEYLGIGDIIFVTTIEVALNDDAEHADDGVLMAIERGTCQRTAFDHLIFHPQIINLFEREVLILAQRIDEPDILLENLCWFHAAKIV